LLAENHKTIGRGENLLQNSILNFFIWLNQSGLALRGLKFLDRDK